VKKTTSFFKTILKQITTSIKPFLKLQRSQGSSMLII
jgi:hypothetical protein